MPCKPHTHGSGGLQLARSCVYVCGSVFLRCDYVAEHMYTCYGACLLIVLVHAWNVFWFCQVDWF